MENTPEPQVLYLCAGPQAWSVGQIPGKTAYDHRISKWKGWTVVWPRELTEAQVQPETILAVRKELEIASILLVDRLKGINEPVSILDHVNRSGGNYLLGRTPHGEGPQFPDMSRIYTPTQPLKGVIVHTVGPPRFSQVLPEDRIVWSEAVGLVAPVLHYCGFTVQAIGAGPPFHLELLLNSIR